MNTTDTVKDIIQSRVDLVKDMQFRLELVHPGTKQRMTPHPMLAHAARTLQERVNAATGAKEGADLWATVMVGADRLYVKPKAGYQLKGLPEVFMGFPVERIAELAS